MSLVRRTRRGSPQAAFPPHVTLLVTIAGSAVLTRHVCGAQSTLYPYIGCFADKHDRVMPKQAQPTIPFTLEECAQHCLNDQPAGEEWKFAGIEFGHECFCGNRYDTHGESYDCLMTLATESHVEAGGVWAISVYDLQESLVVNAATGSEMADGTSSSFGPTSYISTSQEPEDIGGDTPVEDVPRTPVPSGERAFTVVNDCSVAVRVGSTGGRITFSGDDGTEADCDAFGLAAVYNTGPLGRGCYWNLPEEEGGNLSRDLGPGEYARFNLHPTDVDTRWSGTIWGSTGCDRVDGCVTGVCFSPDTDYVCPAYVGPGGPTTKAEFTLSDGGKDYYDISMIDGCNLPMQIEPDNPVYPDEILTNHQMYKCGTPGAPVSPTGLGGCTWSLDYYVEGINEDLRQFLRLVLPADYENPFYCESDLDCTGASEICGVHPQRWADGSYKGGVEQGSCGEHVAWVSAGGACAGGWTTGEFPDAFPFYCGESVTNGQRANMYGCNSGPLAESGYTLGANDNVCGCPDWQLVDVDAPPISQCQGINPEWVELAQPWAHYLKRACPTAYTFPYDDQTSTFDCVDGDESDPDFVNTQSYTITFCPGSTEGAMYP